jgi:hypothetical protein
VKTHAAMKTAKKYREENEENEESEENGGEMAKKAFENYQ